jgi:hypothetical protein
MLSPLLQLAQLLLVQGGQAVHLQVQQPPLFQLLLSQAHLLQRSHLLLLLQRLLQQQLRVREEVPEEWLGPAQMLGRPARLHPPLLEQQQQLRHHLVGLHCRQEPWLGRPAWRSASAWPDLGGHAQHLHSCSDTAGPESAPGQAILVCAG